MASTRYEPGVTMLVDTRGCRWDIVDIFDDAPDDWPFLYGIELQRGMGANGTSLANVLVRLDGSIDWSTFQFTNKHQA
jgi:hypothetical protein